LRDFGYVGDPVGTGIVPSLSHPGGNITGLTAISTEIDAKRLELLREVVPSVSYIAVLWNAASPLQVLAEKQVHAAAQVLRMRVLSLGVKNEEEIKNALAVMARERPGALLVLADRLLLHHRALIMDFAIRYRLPGVHAYRELVEAGGLMSFGPSYADMHRRAAYFVDRILKGTKPGDLPVERPRTFETGHTVTAPRRGVEPPAGTPGIVGRRRCQGGDRILCHANRYWGLAASI
jgi:putative tryptophan/tyrosine transport system substrate-binding protein